jgi:hypothetical protein
MNRAELIEEIKEYIGTPHESVMDYINDADDSELNFFLWRLQNNWTWFDSYEVFINTRTKQIIARDSLFSKYETNLIS